MIKKLLTALFVISALSANAQSGLTNLDFENWTSNLPNGFYGYSISQQTTGAQSGSSYARITITVASGGGADGIMLLGNSLTDIGAPYTQRPYALNGYYRCFFAGIDTMAIAVGLSKNDANVAPLVFYPISQSQSNWTPFTLPFSYINGNTPDTVIFIFFANKNFIVGRPNTVGSYLELDNLSFDFTSGGVIPFEETKNHFSPYPNPASDKVIVSSSDTKARFAVVYDLAGRLVNNYELNSQSVSIDLSPYENGVYMYFIKDEHDAVLYSNKFVVAK